MKDTYKENYVKKYLTEEERAELAREAFSEAQANKRKPYSKISIRDNRDYEQLEVGDSVFCFFDGEKSERDYAIDRTTATTAICYAWNIVFHREYNKNSGEVRLYGRSKNNSYLNKFSYFTPSRGFRLMQSIQKADLAQLPLRKLEQIYGIIKGKAYV